MNKKTTMILSSMVLALLASCTTTDSEKSTAETAVAPATEQVETQPANPGMGQRPAGAQGQRGQRRQGQGQGQGGFGGGMGGAPAGGMGGAPAGGMGGFGGGMGGAPAGGMGGFGGGMGGFGGMGGAPAGAAQGGAAPAGGFGGGMGAAQRPAGAQPGIGGFGGGMGERRQGQGQGGAAAAGEQGQRRQRRQGQGGAATGAAQGGAPAGAAAGEQGQRRQRRQGQGQGQGGAAAGGAMGGFGGGMGGQRPAGAQGGAMGGFGGGQRPAGAAQAGTPSDRDLQVVKNNDLKRLEFDAANGLKVRYCEGQYNMDAPGKPAIILFLHGGGECGTDNAKHVALGLPTMVKNLKGHADRKVILLAPQCPSMGETWGGMGRMTQATNGHLTIEAFPEFIKAKIKEFDADPNRVYITGFSMGGIGTIEVASRNPELFAAAIPICCGGTEEHAAKLANMPISIFQGGADTTVQPARSKAFHEYLVKAGNKNASYKEYPGVGHNSWDTAYADDATFAWLFKQKKSN